MLVTFVLRLLAEPLAQGEVVGEVEHVGGEQTTLHGIDELIRFARDAAEKGRQERP